MKGTSTQLRKARMPHRRRNVTIAAVLLLTPLVALAVWIGIDATFMPGCASCHLTAEFGQQTSASAHSTVECASCHGGSTVLSRVEFGANQVLGMHLSVVEVDPTLAAVGADRCNACHAQVSAGITEANGLRVKHSVCGTGQTCTDCHSTTAHGSAVSWPRTVTMEMCYDCHAKTEGPTECDTCHTDRLPSERVSSSTFQVTHGPNHEQTHGMGRMSTCTPCHDESKCEGCHGSGVPHDARFLSRHGKLALGSDAKCTSCHLKQFCNDCHGTQMPHPDTFMAKHPDLVEQFGQDSCNRCHAEPDCTECHVKHVHPTTLEQQENFGLDVPGAGQ